MIKLTFDGKDLKDDQGRVVINPEIMPFLIPGAPFEWPHGYEVIDNTVWPIPNFVKLLPPSIEESTIENTAHGYTEGSEEKSEPTKEDHVLTGVDWKRAYKDREQKLTASESRVKELEALVGEVSNALEQTIEGSAFFQIKWEKLLLKAKALKS